MEKILIVEDSPTFSSLLKKRVEKELEFPAVVAQSMAECIRIIGENEGEFFVGLLDVNLPDAPRGEVVDVVLSKGIPAIIFTGEINDELRTQLWSRHIVDYVLKNNISNIDYVISLIKRIYDNRSIKVLIVDDSTTSRHYVRRLLKSHRFSVFEAKNAREALDILHRENDIKIVISDYYMPNMKGSQLATEIRKRVDKDEIAIIGISSQGNAATSVDFLKSGANDFINKPFHIEEFYCRLSQNVDILRQFQLIRDLSNKDFLTKLYNRRYLFDTGNKLYAKCRKERAELVVGMLDVDFFKKINDTYGHDAGDEVLKFLSAILTRTFRDGDVVSRFGGEEFCIINVNLAKDEAFDVYEQLRKEIEASCIRVKGQEIRFTVSIGVCVNMMTSLDEMIKEADNKLYEVKRAGRNQVGMMK